MHGDAIKVRLAASPVEGRANAALRAYLADAFGVPLRNVEIIGGQASRAWRRQVRRRRRRRPIPPLPRW